MNDDEKLLQQLPHSLSLNPAVKTDSLMSLTRRDLFAVMAMQACAQRDGFYTKGSYDIALEAVDYADALIAVLDEKHTK